MKKLISTAQDLSLPLLVGVAAALGWANLHHESYEAFIHASPFGEHGPLSVHFIVNDLFMVLFFGIAAKEITESALPGGSLNPMRKAMNPLIATIGGIAGPVAAFFIALIACWNMGLFGEGIEYSAVRRGWGVPTATDIALAWLVSRAVFGAGHPAVNFLLLLAVVDDAIGLGIIAIFYGDPAHPAAPQWLLVSGLGMAAAGTLRMLKVQKWAPYIFIGGPLAWIGLIKANLHPALALVCIVPFLPGPKRDTGLFVQDDEPGVPDDDHSPLHNYEHDTKPYDYAAGAIIASEAGAVVELPSANGLDLSIAAPANIFADLRSAVVDAHT